jgi:hypothetical protein
VPRAFPLNKNSSKSEKCKSSMIGMKDFSILILHTCLLDVLGYSCTCLLPEESVSFEMACIQNDPKAK